MYEARPGSNAHWHRATVQSERNRLEFCNGTEKIWAMKDVSPQW